MSNEQSEIDVEVSGRATNANERQEPVARHYARPLVTDLSAARWLLLAIIAASVYFFHGFLIPVLAASIIAVASWQIRTRLTAHLGRTMAAAALVVAILWILVVPLSLALTYAVAELRIWILWAIEVNTGGEPTPGWLRALPVIGSWVDEQWLTTVGRPGAISEIVHAISGSNIASLYRAILTVGSTAFHLALNILFTLIALFVFYRDGEQIVAQLDRVGTRILPGRWSRMSRIVPATISATVTGMTLIAIGEGVILGTAYWLAGVPSPVIFGVLTGFMALIPGGAPLSFTLISLYLFFSGSTVEGIALFVWGTVELFVVDKTIRPVLIGGPVKLPFLATFFGLVGGVKTMGVVGIFVGPVLMALLMTIWREWQRDTVKIDMGDPHTAPTSSN